MKKTLPFLIPMFRSALFIFGGLLFAIGTNQSFNEASRWWPVLCSVFNMITIFVLVMVCKYEDITYWDLINYKKGTAGIGYILLVIVLMFFVGIGGMITFGILIYGYMPNMIIKPISVWVAVINMIILPLTIVFAEMPLYFGYSFNRIKDKKNIFFAIGYVVFFYALQHCFIPLLFNWNYIFFRFLSFLPLMTVLSILYYKKRNLMPLMVGHGILDLATGIQILLASISPEIFDIIQNSTPK